jgi:HtrA serine peptidase 2
MNRLFFYRHRRHFTCVSAALFLRSSYSDSECSEESRSRYSNFIADAVDIASPSVVNIQCEVSSGFVHGTSTGSGFIIDKSGFIITNAHVVSRASPNKRINIRLWNSGTTRTAVLHSLDADSDIALVKLDKVDDDLPVAKLGSSATLRAGEFVCALGSPLMLQNSVTAGIISSTARHSSELGLGKNLNEYIQTDCAINQGNSGGPLVNMKGEVVGVNVMRAQADGISFSIPIDTVISVAKQLMRSGKVSRPKVGMRIVNYVETPKALQGSRKSAILDSAKGVKILVMEVEKNSAAEQAGLRSGDVIYEVQGKQTNGVRELLDIIGHSDVHELEISVFRDGHEEQLYLKLR